MLTQITAILTAATTILDGIVGGIGDVATFMFSNPMTLLGVGFVLVGMVFKPVRRLLRH